MSEVKFSILIPAIPERIGLLSKLLEKLNPQTENQPVEVIILMDNKKRPLGDKRNLMMRECQGKFLAHLDDDDSISDDYVSSILAALDRNPNTDVVCFWQQADLGDNMPYTVYTSLAFENEDSNIAKKKVDGKVIQYRPNIRRKPWHWCVWRTEIARQGVFPLEFYAEDWLWLQQVIPLCRTETQIDKILHYYFYNKQVSLS